jgi:hypothetical protein
MYVSHSVTPPITVRSQVVRSEIDCYGTIFHHRHQEIVLFGSVSGELYLNYLVLYYHFDSIFHSLSTARFPGVAHKILYAAILSSVHPSTSTNVRPGCHCCLEIWHHGFNRRSGYRISYILLGHPMEQVAIEPSMTIRDILYNSSSTPPPPLSPAWWLGLRLYAFCILHM